ncbi:MAG: HAMP domain-containing sensor histidine kinase [bacterium]|nr:HAMP domain-containing sensor histidine kinase [bacterium]
MKRLRNKTFLLLFTIISLFTFILLLIFNVLTYSREKEKILTNLNRISSAHNSFDLVLNRPILLDSIAYVVTYDINRNIISVINYTDKEVDKDKLVKLARIIIKENKEVKVGNLYFNNYSYLNNQNSIIIIDNSESKKIVRSSFVQSFIIFVLSLVIILYISAVLTKWLVKPVIDSFEKQKDFICDASHELKTPLAVILANAEMLESEPNEKKWLNNIKSESERMSKLVTDLLELSRMENNSTKMYFKDENISKIILKTVLTFESLIYENNLKIDYDIKEDLKLKCDAERIKQLLTILIDNAIKHSYKNSTLRVNLYKEKDNIILEVINRGDEIPKSERTKIFERFYKADKSRNRNDNRYGLGLAIATNIVNSHNGKISVDCKSGYTTFTVNFKTN